jgi:hypothetical protein
MSDKRIGIAKDFVDQHKSFSLGGLPSSEFDDDDYLTVFSNLTGGVYGECRGLNPEFDGDGDLLIESTEFEIEIGSFESKTGSAYVFWFEYEQ